MLKESTFKAPDQYDENRAVYLASKYSLSVLGRMLDKKQIAIQQASDAGDMETLGRLQNEEKELTAARMMLLQRARNPVRLFSRKHVPQMERDAHAASPLWIFSALDDPQDIETIQASNLVVAVSKMLAELGYALSSKGKAWQLVPFGTNKRVGMESFDLRSASKEDAMMEALSILGWAFEGNEDEEITEALEFGYGSVEDRPGPGKFEGHPSKKEADRLYDIMLDGGDAELYDPMDNERVYTLIVRDASDEDDMKHLASPAYIVWETDQGFFESEAFKSEKEAREKFGEMEAQIELDREAYEEEHGSFDEPY